jgi:protein gp37
MGKTNIEYCDEVSNPLYVVDKETGKTDTHCEKPDPEGTCKNCWAEVLNMRGKPDNKRFGTGLAFDKENRERIEWRGHGVEMARLIRLNAKKPMSAKFPGNPLIVFTNDTYDLFQPTISDALRDWVFDNYDKLEDLTILIQTTYVSAMSRYLKARYPNGMPPQYFIGMSAGNQEFLAANIRHLLAIKAQRLYLILEPILEAMRLTQVIQPDGGVWDILRGLDTHYHMHLVGQLALVIVGGESGSDPRPCDIQWIRRVTADCQAAGIAVLVKQLGAKPVDGSRMTFCEDKFPIKTKSRKGGKIDEFPLDLQIRQFPGQVI